MSKWRRNHSTAVQVRIASEALKGDKTQGVFHLVLEIILDRTPQSPGSQTPAQVYFFKSSKWLAAS